jgi:hypothetical protein
VNTVMKFRVPYNAAQLAVFQEGLGLHMGWETGRECKIPRICSRLYSEVAGCFTAHEESSYSLRETVVKPFITEECSEMWSVQFTS